MRAGMVTTTSSFLQIHKEGLLIIKWPLSSSFQITYICEDWSSKHKQRPRDSSRKLPHIAWWIMTILNPHNSFSLQLISSVWVCVHYGVVSLVMSRSQITRDTIALSVAHKTFHRSLHAFVRKQPMKIIQFSFYRAGQVSNCYEHDECLNILAQMQDSCIPKSNNTRFFASCGGNRWKKKLRLSSVAWWPQQFHSSSSGKSRRRNSLFNL